MSVNLTSPKTFGGTATKATITRIILDPAGTLDVEINECAADGTCLGTRNICIKGDSFTAATAGMLAQVENYLADNNLV